MTTLRLTARHLTDAGACADQVTLFKQTFPKGAPLTAASLTKANAADLDVLWAVVLLDALSLAEYRRVNGLARAEYDRVAGPAWAEYQRVNGTTWAKYQRVSEPASAEYYRVSGLALLAALRATFRRTAKATP